MRHDSPTHLTMPKLLGALGLTILVSLTLAKDFLGSLPPQATDLSLSVGSIIENATQEGNSSGCQGYNLQTLQEDEAGLTAKLSLVGESCQAFGEDIVNLTVRVTYETATRLHVNIFDTSDEQYTIPQSVVQRPQQIKDAYRQSSDLVFNYESSPFSFWITRKAHPDATPLFDTRLKSMPPTPIPAVDSSDTYKNTTSLNNLSFVFEKQYLQLTSALPKDTNIYGLGEAVASSGFRRNLTSTVQAMWARDVADPVDENAYGSHPIYLEHRFDSATQTSQSHGVFLLSAAGGDILLRTPPSGNISVIQYRMIGGVLDFYFFSGPSPKAVIEQYGELIGMPTWQPIWGFGFHLCRWGYQNIAETREQVTSMRAANIPLEVMWNDIDLYHAVRDFTSDPVSFPGEEMRQFIRDLASSNQHYIPIVDAAIPKQVNASDLYDPYTKGVAKDVFIKNPDGTEYVGQVWPGYTVFPDWFQNNTQDWWTEALRNWSQAGIEFSGIWLDMNEASSFCDGSCGTDADISNTSVPFILPGEPGNFVTDYPECYNSTVSGPSGNITVNGTLTCHLDTAVSVSLNKRGLGAGKQEGVDLNTPQYAIHNGFGRLSNHALATNATHVDGQVELDTHNLWGLMEEKATHLALKSIQPGKRPFLISRSTFPSSGRWTGHWLGDNFSLWAYLRHSISGVLQFQIFQIPFVGADTCGFVGNTDEELCNRWMQLSAFTPFYRNHNIKGAIPQEPYRWDSVADASRKAIAVRYALLPYWYTLFALSSTSGTPPVRALFFEFPDEPELFDVDSQFLVGSDILVTPVLYPNSTTVQGYFPGHGNVTWRDWYTHEAAKPTSGQKLELQAPLSHINVDVRDGSAILLHAEPAYTIEETRQGPYSLLVSLDFAGKAQGNAYIDDGISNPPGPSRTLTFTASQNQLVINGNGSFSIQQRLQDIFILGVTQVASNFKLNGQAHNATYDATVQKLSFSNVNVDLNGDLTMTWA
ncbi:glycosyl hydrolases family 31-domain-containing protein [Crepidotus variabilis]|uniref:alpha-glucosidase n=1 Tax=Crepidotus variabilis TaxID=179855 RepID=A0A9P6JNG4_9AGAR|nr:glycosyl hydrolases family 31-domain-containing protein [Crepidotus variabilis]